MTDSITHIGETPYAGQGEHTSPRQMDLFGEYNVELEVDPEALEELLRFVLEQRKRRQPRLSHIMTNALFTFNLAPAQNIRKHLRKARCAPSSEEAIASDWTNVAQDVYVSFLKNAIEVERTS